MCAHACACVRVHSGQHSCSQSFAARSCNIRCCACPTTRSPDALDVLVLVVLVVVEELLGFVQPLEVGVQLRTKNIESLPKVLLLLVVVVAAVVLVLLLFLVAVVVIVAVVVWASSSLCACVRVCVCACVLACACARVCACRQFAKLAS